MHEDPFRKLKQVCVVIGAIGVGIMLIALVGLVAVAQFEVYQKKHGSHMTFLDYILDSERK